VEKRLVYALHAPTCEESQHDLVLQVSSSGVVTLPSLVAMEKSEGGHLGGATCFFFNRGVWRIYFVFLFFPSPISFISKK